MENPVGVHFFFVTKIVQTPENVSGDTNAPPSAGARQELLNKENQILRSINLSELPAKEKQRIPYTIKGFSRLSYKVGKELWNSYLG